MKVHSVSCVYGGHVDCLYVCVCVGGGVRGFKANLWCKPEGALPGKCISCIENNTMVQTGGCATN